jgi:hypothetical protein
VSSVRTLVKASKGPLCSVNYTPYPRPAGDDRAHNQSGHLCLGL